MPISGPPLQISQTLLDPVELTHLPILLYGPDDRVGELRYDGGHARGDLAFLDFADEGLELVF
jgi:hypothetical protein